MIDTIITTVRREAKRLGWSKAEAAQFLAQIEHESASFTRTKELGYRPERAFQLFGRRFGTLANAQAIHARQGSAGLFEVMYGNRSELGNTMPGDGAKYIGRGYIQITGKANYALVEKETGLPVVSNPQLLENPEVATIASIVWWQRNVHPRIRNWDDSAGVTRIVNGPALLGLADRRRKYNKWVKIV